MSGRRNGKRLSCLRASTWVDDLTDTHDQLVSVIDMSVRVCHPSQLAVSFALLDFQAMNGFKVRISQQLGWKNAFPLHHSGACTITDFF